MKVASFIKNLVPYPPGKPIEELKRELGLKDIVKMASNENPLGPSLLAVQAIKDSLSKINFYPDGSGYYLRRRLAEELNVKMENIILGNGSNEIIELLMRTFLTCEDDAVIFSFPSFAVYRIVAQAMGRKKIEIPLKDYRHNLREIKNKINENTRLVFVDIPNNPTGTIVYEDELNKFIEGIDDNCLIVLDEAYFGYSTDKDYPDVLSFFRNNKNVFVLRTFAKLYGLAGLRIGYGIGSKKVIDYLNRVRQPFNVNSLAQIGARVALDDKKHVKKTLEVNKKGKNFLYRAFEDMGIEYISTYANYILFDMKQDAEKIYDKLLHKGVIIRLMKGYGYNTHLRVTIGTEEQNKKFIECLKEVIGV
jgi:histidinol-phosphate aminotransferase